MTTKQLLPEQTPNTTDTMAGNPPTYAESIASETSFNKPPTLSRSASFQPQSQHQQQQQEQYQQQQQQQQQSSEKRHPGRFNSRFHAVTSTVGRPLNKAANIVGAEGWWPSRMERECGKAARILHSFTTLETAEPPRTSGPKHPIGISRKSMVKIPPEVLQSCAGLAIFNVLRAGTFHGSLAAGSGLVVARLPDGSWSPPSSFVVSTVGVGLTVGLDVYDCVCVLNTPEQVRSFTSPRFSLGGAASVAVGPLGAGSSLEAAFSRTARPVWSYIKSRGLWAGVQIDGTVIVSRADANAVFYNERASVERILSGQMAWPDKGAPLREVLKAIDGRVDLDRDVLGEVARQPTPGDDAYMDEKAAIEAASEELQQETAEQEKAKLAQAGF